MQGDVYGADQERFGFREHESEFKRGEREFARGEGDEEGERGERVEYRRYIKEFTPRLATALLRHNMGRFPAVDIYLLLPVHGDNYHFGKEPGEKDYTNTKFLVYWGDEDADALDVLIQVYHDREFLGVSFARMLEELGVRYDDHRTLNDVVNDMFEALFKDPNDEIEHAVSAWVRGAYNQGRTIRSLREGGEWDNMRVGIRAKKIGYGQQQLPPTVEVTQINYKSLMLEVINFPDAADQKVDLMILLNA